MKNPIKNILITHQEFTTLLSFDDKYRKNKKIFEEDLTLRKSLITTSIIIIINLLLIDSIIYRIQIKNKLDSIAGILILIYFLIITLGSWLTNKYIFYLGKKLNYGIVLNILDKFKIYLEDDEDIKNLTAYISVYWFDFTTLRYKILIAINTILFILILPINLTYKTSTIIISIIVSLIMALSGKGWTKFNKIITNNIRKEKNLTPEIMRKRVVFPTIYNLLSGPLLTISMIFLVTLGIAPLITIVSQITPTITYSWILIQKYTTLSITKKSLLEINKKLSKIQNQYIINNTSYQKLCKQVSPQNKNTADSKNLLTLKKFTPMAITNQKKKNRTGYSINLKPDLYQLKGYNGVGKTTFLKSLTIPEKSWVEYSKGYVSYLGEPLFNEKDSLENHREKYRYLGNGFKTSIDEFDPEHFSNYPSIYEFLMNYLENVHTINSEGENAVLGICKVYYDLEKRTRKINLIAIDEIISRIYNSEDFPLRHEIIKLIVNMSKNKDLIVIVVDHAHKIKKATELIMFKDSIEIKTNS